MQEEKNETSVNFIVLEFWSIVFLQRVLHLGLSRKSLHCKLEISHGFANERFFEKWIFRYFFEDATSLYIDHWILGNLRSTSVHQWDSKTNQSHRNKSIHKISLPKFKFTCKHQIDIFNTNPQQMIEMAIFIYRFRS